MTEFQLVLDWKNFQGPMLTIEHDWKINNDNKHLPLNKIEKHIIFLQQQTLMLSFVQQVEQLL